MRRARSVAFPAAALTLRDIVGGLLLAVAAGSLLDALHAVLPLPIARGLAFIAAVLILLSAISLWGRDMTRVAQLRSNGISKGAAVSLAAIIGLIGFTLGLAEPLAVKRGAGFNLRIDQVYTLLFAPATFVVSTTAAYLLARGESRANGAARVAILTGVASAAAFLTVDLTLDALGWRIGAPGAGRRATMVVVTTLSLTLATLVAGGVIGILLYHSPDAPETA